VPEGTGALVLREDFFGRQLESKVFGSLDVQLALGASQMRARKLIPVVVWFGVSAAFADAGSFGSWAARGVVVKKEFRSTAGLDGIYRLELRGEDQKVRREMVPRKIFLACEVGDSFDEQTSPAAVKQGRIAARPKAEVKVKANRWAKPCRRNAGPIHDSRVPRSPREKLPESRRLVAADLSPRNRRLPIARRFVSSLMAETEA
jgi:hypothetical protein